MATGGGRAVFRERAANGLAPRALAGPGGGAGDEEDVPGGAVDDSV